MPLLLPCRVCCTSSDVSDCGLKVINHISFSLKACQRERIRGLTAQESCACCAGLAVLSFRTADQYLLTPPCIQGAPSPQGDLSRATWGSSPEDCEAELQSTLDPMVSAQLLLRLYFMENCRMRP